MRVKKVDSSGTRNYITDGDSPAAPVLADGLATYTPGLSERRSSTSAFYHPDALGSTMDITNSSQTVTDTRRTDGFGMSLATTGSNPTPFGFGGAEQYQSDSDSGLMLLGHRYYDCSVGRFISQDPIQAGDNWYAYCENNPIVAADPTGLNPPKHKHVTDPMPGANPSDPPVLWKIIPDPKKPYTDVKKGKLTQRNWHMVAVDQNGNEYNPKDGSIPQEDIRIYPEGGNDRPPNNDPRWIGTGWHFPRFTDPNLGSGGSKNNQWWRGHKDGNDTTPLESGPTRLEYGPDGTDKRIFPDGSSLGGPMVA